jgi:hypothetical protein
VIIRLRRLNFALFEYYVCVAPGVARAPLRHGRLHPALASDHQRWLAAPTTACSVDVVHVHALALFVATDRDIAGRGGGAISSQAERLPDTSSYEWEVLLQLVAPLLLRVRAVGEQGVEHVAQMNFE